MQLKYINRPVFIDRRHYDKAIGDIASNLTSLPGVKTVYRFGNITTPGISDIDLLVVFKNGVKSNATGFENFYDDYHLFTHGIMAVSEDHFYKNIENTVWSSYIYIKGEQMESRPLLRTAEETNRLKIQTALEFIAANYIDIKLQMSYRTFKLRSLLQHMKGLIYDLEYLNITEGKILMMLKTFRDWSLNWFERTPADSEITGWIMEFNEEFDKFCSEVFHQYPFCLPLMNQYHVARNAVLNNGNTVSFNRSGFVLPHFLAFLEKKYISLNNRFNSFQFFMPIHTPEPEGILNDRFIFLREMKAYNKIHLPGFMTITTSITSKII